jgi:hypothetical protein
VRPCRRSLALTAVLWLAAAAPPAAADVPAAAPQISEPEPLDQPPRRPSEKRYESRGVRSKFCFGAGLHVGVNSLRSKRPLLGGASLHFRMKGVFGLSLEYDFNRVATTPAATDLGIRALHFIPNLRASAVIYPYRWRMIGPFILGGLGLDTGSNESRVNLQVGGGLEVTFWRDRIALLGEFRAFLPLPSDVEKHKQRLSITGGHIPKTGTYYHVDNFLFLLSLRFYY